MTGTGSSTFRETARPSDDSAPPETERRTSSVELFWDLVFVFAVTQVTTLLSHHLTWGGFGRGMLILALVWWAWSAFVWAANAETDDSRVLRLALLGAAGFIFVSGLALPQAFGSEGVLFAVTYAVVRLIHLGLYADVSRRGRAAWSAIVGFATTVLLGMGLLLAGAALHGGARIALWAAAVAIDYAGPAWLTRERLRGLQHVAVAHFAERYSLFVIICLGESIVAIGAGATSGDSPLTVELVAVVALGFIATAAMWWTYFDRLAQLAEQRLRVSRDPVLTAADAYSYLHLVIVAGIIIFAVGVRLLVRAPDQIPSGAVRLALCGGVAVYILGHVGFALRMTGRVGYLKIGIAAALLVVYATGSGLSAWGLAALIAGLLVVLCLLERIALPSERRAA
jgi:low temperature requirement protein LtrA